MSLLLLNTVSQLVVSVSSSCVVLTIGFADNWAPPKRDRVLARVTNSPPHSRSSPPSRSHPSSQFPTVSSPESPSSAPANTSSPEPPALHRLWRLSMSPPAGPAPVLGFGFPVIINASDAAATSTAVFSNLGWRLSRRWDEERRGSRCEAAPLTALPSPIEEASAQARSEFGSSRRLHDSTLTSRWAWGSSRRPRPRRHGWLLQLSSSSGSGSRRKCLCSIQRCLFEKIA